MPGSILEPPVSTPGIGDPKKHGFGSEQPAPLLLAVDRSGFIGLIDTPRDYHDQAGKFCIVNSSEEALEFSSVQNIPLADLPVADPLVAGRLWRNGTNLQVSLG
jgi:hypothetical protein